MRKKKKSESNAFWLAIFSALVLSGGWALFRDKPIEVRDVSYSHQKDHSDVSFEVRNNTSDKKIVQIVVHSGIHTNSEYRINSRTIASKFLEVELYGNETKKFEDELYYPSDVRFLGSIVSVEAFEKTSNELVETIEADSKSH